MKIGMEVELSGDEITDTKKLREFGIALTYHTDKICRLAVDEDLDVASSLEVHGYEEKCLGRVFRTE